MMTTYANCFSFSKTIIALAILAAYGSANAGLDDDLEQYANPYTATVSVGLGHASGSSEDRSLWGQYNGMREHDNSLLLDFDYLKRNDETATWSSFYGHNLGLDNRELGAALNKQGAWKLSLDYSEIVRHDPRTINTFISGAGTATPTVNTEGVPGAGTDLNLELHRKRATLGGDMWLSPSLQAVLSFTNEEKDGARLWGKGFACGAAWVGTACTANTSTQWMLLMLPEPVDSTTRQLEAKLNFIGEKLAMTGGYYGSFYNNKFSVLDPTLAPGATFHNFVGAGSTAISDALLQTTMGLPMALPPDNQAHQLYVSGNYAFTPTTRGTFKYAYTYATQNETFPSVYTPTSAVTRTDLGGKVVTQEAMAGITARPMPKLSLLGNVRYENKNDKTPLQYYNVEGAEGVACANCFTNNPTDSTRLVGKVEGTYQLAPMYKLTLGLDYEGIDRDLPVSTTELAGITYLREKTDELGYRAELRHNLSETLNGSIAYINSQRDGSNLYTVSTGLIIPYSAIAAGQGVPTYLANRDREKWRLMGDWTPNDRFSLQFMLENGSDSADTGAGDRAWRYTDYDMYSLDAAYAISEVWKLSAYASVGTQTFRVDGSGDKVEVEDTNSAAGLTLTGKISSKFSIGAGLSYTEDKNHYVQFTATGSVPDVVFRATNLNVNGTYNVDKYASIRVDLSQQWAKLDEWTWGFNGTPFTYSDGTTVSLQPKQNVTFIGVRYAYKFH